MPLQYDEQAGAYVKTDDTKTCAGAGPRGGSCWVKPEWAIYNTHQSRKPDAYACDRHLHNNIDRERGAIVTNAQYH